MADVIFWKPNPGRNPRFQVANQGGKLRSESQVGIPAKVSNFEKCRNIYDKVLLYFLNVKFFWKFPPGIPTPHPQMGFPGRNHICIFPAWSIEYVYNLKPRKIGMQ